MSSEVEETNETNVCIICKKAAPLSEHVRITQRFLMNTGEAVGAIAMGCATEGCGWSMPPPPSTFIKNQANI